VTENSGAHAVGSDPIATTGNPVDRIPVTIGPQFLERFSEHLYSSPNKAFEELIANSWDAGARTVYVHVPTDPSAAGAAIWILDDGESMDLSGLRALWAVASSGKRDRPPARGRPQIGKFGLGKLATYILAHQLTYVCRAADGVVRAVTMDFRRIAEAEPAELMVPPIDLVVRELTPKDLEQLLSEIDSGGEIGALLQARLPPPAPQDWEDEFGGPKEPPVQTSETWVLVLLTSLKSAGEALEAGRIRWMLRTALPLGATMAIVYNGETLVPSKIAVPVAREWSVGPGLGIEALVVGPNDRVAAVVEHDSPYPHLIVEGVSGAITGRVRLYADRISGGKSELMGASNGFQVNVLGRVIRPSDPYFGLENLNHSAWAKFRATIRADGLDEQLAVSRDALRESEALETLRALLRVLFNKARNAHDAAAAAAWEDVGRKFARSWSAVPFDPLGRLVRDGIHRPDAYPEFIDASGIDKPDLAAAEWNDGVEAPGDVVEDVVLEDRGSEAPLVVYDVARRSVIVNTSHPFVHEHSASREEKLLLRDTGLVDLMTAAFMADVGLDQELLRDAARYRDQLLRLVAQVNRTTGARTAQLLIGATNNPKGLEILVGDALEDLGFEVLRLGASGQPEGVASAPVTPLKEGAPAFYSLTYDAKSSATGKVSTKDVNTAGLARHRVDHGAQHTLVIAPDYEIGALTVQCKTDNVTPMRAATLAKLLMLASAVGPLDLTLLRGVFGKHDPNEVDTWVAAFVADASGRRRLSLGLVLRVIGEIGYVGPNPISADVVADRIAGLTHGAIKPGRSEVTNVVRGLSVVAPHLIRVVGGNDIFLSTSPAKLRELLLLQLRDLPHEYTFGLPEAISSSATT